MVEAPAPEECLLPECGSTTTCCTAASANLDRIQIVKGWVDADGEPQTKVFDVAWAGDREPDADGTLPPVGSTVDGADFTNTIGAAALSGYWVDPEFDPAQRAYYYVRVLEIPTPSWLAYDEAFYGPLDLPYDAVMVQQDRAYTSPIHRPSAIGARSLSRRACPK